MKIGTNLKKRIIALFLAAVLLVSMGTTAVHAEEKDREIELLMEKQKAAVQLIRAYWQRCIPRSGGIFVQPIDYSPEMLSTQSAVIATGKITGRSDAFQVIGYSGAITVFTDFYFTITDSIKGTPYAETVSVRIPGGKVGNYEEVFSPDPQFNVGDEYLLFLYNPGRGSSFVTEEEHYFLVGFSQGAYVKNAEGEFVNTLGGGKLPEAALLPTQSDEVYDEEHFRSELKESYQSNYENGLNSWEEYQENLASLEYYAVKVE